MSDTSITRRSPKRSITAAANGAMDPYISRLRATADEIVARDQWNSSSRGTISTLGAERTPAPTSSTTNATPTTIQP